MNIRRYFIILFFILCITFSSSRIFASPSTPLLLTDSERAWLKAHPNITFAFTLDHEPSLIKDGNGNYSGHLWDFFELLNDRSGANIQLEVCELEECIQKVKNREVDGALSITEGGAKNIGLVPTEAYYHAPFTIFTRDAIASEIDGYQSLNNRKVALIRGAGFPTSFLKKNAPEAEIVYAKNNQMAMRLVFEGKVDAYLGYSLYNYLIGKYQMSGVVPAFTDMENPSAFVYGIRPDWPELVSIVNKVIAYTTIEERIGILEKWSRMDFGRGEKPDINLTEEERSWLKVHPVITLGADIEWPPFQMVDEKGKFNGIDSDYIRLLEEKTGLKVRMEPQVWSQAVNRAKNHEIDGLSAAVITDDRKKHLIFSSVYFASPAAVYIRRETENLHGFEDLNGRVLAIEEGSSHLEFIKKNYPAIKVLKTPDVLTALISVSEGKSDGAYGVLGVLHHLTGSHYINNLKSGLVHFSEEEGQFRIAVRNDAPLLLSILDKGIAAITEREHREIRAKWLGDEAATRRKRPLQLTAEERTWIREHPVIRVGVDHYPPFEIVDGKGSYEGLGAEYLHLIGKNTGLNFKMLTGLTWAEVQEGARNGTVDLIPVITSTAERREYLLFTEGYLHESQVVITRIEHPSIKGMADLKGKTMAVSEGYSEIEDLNRDFPSIKQVVVRNALEELKLVSSGQVDACQGNLAVINYYIRKHNLSNLKIAGPSDIGGSGVMAIGSRKDWPVLHAILKKGLKSISEPERIAISRKWTPDLEAAKVAALELTKAEQAWLKAHPSIRLGFNPDMQPLLIQDKEGQFSGILPDIFKQLEAVTGLNVGIEVGPWHEIIKQAGRGEIDGLLGCVPALAKAKGLLPTMEYIPTIPVVFGKRDAPYTIKGIDDLKGKRVAYMRAVKFIENILAPLGNETTAIEADSFLTALTMVLEGKADVFLGMNFDTYLLNQSVLTGIEPVFIDTSHVVKAVTAVRSDWPELADILNQGLAAIGDADINKILQKWTRIETPKQKMALSDSERAWLAEHPIVRVALDPDWAPVEFMDEKGDYHGISVEYLNRLEKLMGVRFEIAKGLSWQEAVNGVENKTQDIFASVAKTPGREKYLLFTRPYVSMPINIFARNDVSYIGNLDVLAGKKVAVVKGYAIHEWLKNNHPKIDLVPLPSIPDGLNQLASGDVTAYVGNVVTTSYYIGKLHLNNLRVAGETPYANNQSMAVRDDWPELAGILQKALDAIPQHERNSIYNSWMSIKYEHAFDYSLLWKIGIGVGVFFIMVLAWNVQIQRQRTALRSARDAAEAANRAKNEFLANMSHELRTPLNSILGYAQILQPQKNLNERQEKDIGIIRASGEHLLSLINEILDFAKIEVHKVEIESLEFNLPALIQHVSNIAKLQSQEKQLSFQLEERSILPHILMGDAQKVTQVLLNLLNNAVKYTNTGGVTFRVSYQPERQRLLCEVEDTGIGIEPDQLKKIFEPFTQVGECRRTTAGAGLGLAISRKFVDSMNGQLSVKSELGKGSVFSLELDLPAVEKAEITMEKEVKQIVGYQGDRKKILIVDDNVSNLSMITSLLEPLGFEVALAENGQEAIHRIEKNFPDLILLDLVMPVMDGLGVAREIRDNRQWDHIKIIGISASASDQPFKQEFVKTCDAFLTKPVQINSLLEYMMKQMKLEWIVEKPETKEPALPISKDKAQVEEKIPPREILEQLRINTEHGYFGKISDLLEELVAQDNKYQVFCSKMDQFVESYDDEGILEYLTEMSK